MSVQEEIGLRVVALCFIDLGLFLHSTGCAQPIRQRNVRIVCVVPGLFRHLRKAHGGVDGSHEGECCGCGGVGTRYK